MGFSRLEQLRVRAELTRPFTLNAVVLVPAGPVKLTVRFAGEANAAYDNALYKLVNDLRARTAGGRASQAGREADRQEDARLFADHVITAWENVAEDDGKPAPFTPDKVNEFLLALIASVPDSFDLLRRYCKDADNFRDAPLPGAEALGKG